MNKIGNYLIIMGILFIIFGVCLFTYDKYEEFNANKMSKEVLNIIENNIEDYEVTINNSSSSVINIDGYYYIGTIELPSLNIKLPIMSSTSYENLSIAPCLYYGSILTNDAVICAHDYFNQFGKIDNLSVGDLVIITDVLGNSYVYNVVLMEALNPTDIELMVNSEFDLTLYTCSYGALKRITVRLNRLYEYV